MGRISVHTALPMAGLDTSRIGTFGFFECENDASAARALFEAGERWLLGRAAARVLGPMNFSMNQECGVLIEGFETPPFVLMNHNPSWYAGLVEGCGYRKAKDLYAWRYTVGTMPDSLLRLAERTRRAGRVTVRAMDPKRFDEETRTVLRIFNSAWAENWGFTPMLEEEFDDAIREMRRIVDPKMVLLAEKEGKPIGIAVTLPNLNEALVGLGGRISPLGLVRLIWRLKVQRPRTARCLMLGVESAARRFGAPGLSALLYVEMSEAGRRRGVEWGEVSWTLEDNDAINNGIRATGAHRYKTYRIYAKELGP